MPFFFQQLVVKIVEESGDIGYYHPDSMVVAQLRDFVEDLLCKMDMAFAFIYGAVDWYRPIGYYGIIQSVCYKPIFIFSLKNRGIIAIDLRVKMTSEENMPSFYSPFGDSIGFYIFWCLMAPVDQRFESVPGNQSLVGNNAFDGHSAA